MNSKTKDDKNASSHVTEEVLKPEEHAKYLYEKKYNCKLINLEELRNKGPWDSDLAEKLVELSRYGNVDSVMTISIPEIQYQPQDEDWRRIIFYTNDHVYCISIHWRDSKETSYLGCTVSTRKNRPGEIWNRGNDLPDGKYNEDTWKNILIGILRFEMKTLQI